MFAKKYNVFIYISRKKIGNDSKNPRKIAK